MPPLDPGPSHSDVPRESARSVLFQFVVFPLGVVAIAVGIFFLFGRLASEDQSVRDYLSDIRSGSDHRKWQAAYQLSKSLKRGEAKQYPNLVNDVIAVYRDAKGDDPRIRQYLSLVLGRLGDKRATPVLLDALRDQHIDTRIYALLALGELRDPAAVPEVIKAAADGEKDVEKTALYTLGQLGDPRALPLLVAETADPVPDVRYNAGIALARFGDKRSIGVLREMMDRERLARVAGMRDDQKEETVLAAMSAWVRVTGADGRGELEQLAQGDPSLRVQAAAKEALTTLR